MVVTKDEARTAHEFHEGECIMEIGVRGGVNMHVARWRPNGRMKEWKTEPHKFCRPIKYGLRGYGYLDHGNAHQFHTQENCGLNNTNPAEMEPGRYACRGPEIVRIG